MKQIVFIYRDEFVTKTVEKLCKAAGVQCYSLTKIEENFSYIINDLEPDLVLIDEVSLEKYPELINQSLSDSNKNFKTVLFSAKDSSEGLDFVINLPLKLDTLIEQMRSLVEKNS